MDFGIRHFLAMAGMLLAATLTCGQMPREMHGRMNLNGTIAAIGRGKIQVTTANLGQWIVDLSNQTSVMVTGKGDASLLSPGMYVRFQVEITGRDKVAGTIQRIHVFTPTPQDTPGVFPIQGIIEANHQQPDDSHKPTPKPSTPKSSATKPPATKQVTATKYDVVGRITGIQKGHILVSYGQGTVQVEPAANLEVTLAVADIRFARLGDQITCLGMLAGPESSRMMRASSVQIAHGKPAGPDPKEIAWPLPPTREPTKEAKDPKAESERLIQWLTPRSKTTKKETFTIDNDPTVFQPCVGRSTTSLIREFGPPQKAQVSGTLTIRDHAKIGKWQLWTWGPVKVVIDRTRKARFFAVAK